MALHERDVVRDQMAECVFADRDLTRPVPKYRFPEVGSLPRDAYQLVADELMLDGNARQNLATFCQTWEEPEVLALCDSSPSTGIPTVTWRIRDGQDPGYTLFDLADRLRTRGWQVPAYTLTGTAAGIAVQRILVRLGVSRDMAALLLDDFRDAVAHFTKHPVTVSMTKEESGGFSHL